MPLVGFLSGSRLRQGRYMKKTDDARTSLARREFLKTTGALVVGFTVRPDLSAVQQGDGPARWERGVKSGPPDNSELDSYIAIHPDNTATIFSGYVDLGQGGPTALRQIAAEELDLDFSQVLMVRRRHVRLHERLHGGQPDGRHRRHRSCARRRPRRGACS